VNRHQQRQPRVNDPPAASPEPGGAVLGTGSRVGKGKVRFHVPSRKGSTGSWRQMKQTHLKTESPAAVSSPGVTTGLKKESAPLVLETKHSLLWEYFGIKCIELRLLFKIVAQSCRGWQCCLSAYYKGRSHLSTVGLWSRAGLREVSVQVKECHAATYKTNA